MLLSLQWHLGTQRRCVALAFVGVRVNRGPSLMSCGDAIAAAVVADIVAREQRAKAAERRREEAFLGVLRRPLSVALVERRK